MNRTLVWVVGLVSIAALVSGSARIGWGVDENATKDKWPMEKKLAAGAELVVRGVAEENPAVKGQRGGWPTYQLTLDGVYKGGEKFQRKAGEVIQVKTLADLPKTRASYYLKWDADQKLFRTLGNDLKDTVSHIEPPKAAAK